MVSVGDGLARVYELNEIQTGEMVEFVSSFKGLENENVVFDFFIYFKKTFKFQISQIKKTLRLVQQKQHNLLHIVRGWGSGVV